MPTSSSTGPGSFADVRTVFIARVKPFLAPYYLTIAGVLGAITAGFVALIALIVILATNFNVLGWME